MTFRFGYNTRDNERRVEEIVASSKSDVYAKLRKRGIKPFFVELKPGLLNRIESIGKRGLAIVVLAVVASASSYFAFVATLGVSPGPDSPTPRHQIYGDPAVMDELVASDFTGVFDDSGLRLLAHYAQPGVLPPLSAVRNASLGNATLDAPIVFDAGDSREVRELKCIVLWMQGELRDFIGDGETFATYARRLVERTEEEIAIYETAKRDLAKEKNEAVWDEKNARLRRIGLRTIPRPKASKEASPKRVKNPIDGVRKF